MKYENYTFNFKGINYAYTGRVRPFIFQMKTVYVKRIWGV